MSENHNKKQTVILENRQRRRMTMSVVQDGLDLVRDQLYVVLVVRVVILRGNWHGAVVLDLHVLVARRPVAVVDGVEVREARPDDAPGHPGR